MSDRRRDAAERTAHAALPALSSGGDLKALDALAVLALALGLRVWHLLALRSSPFFDVLMGDSQGYDRWARELAAGDWIGSEVFYQAPLYPYFLGVLYSAMSDDLLVVRFAQALVGSLSCVFLALAASRFLQSRAAGIAAGVMLAVYAPAIFHDALIQKSALDLFWLCGLLWLLSRIQHEPRALTSWAAGAALGALTLTRENAGVLLLPIACWLWLGVRGVEVRRLGLLAALMAGLASALLPVALRNYSIDGDIHLTTSQFGPNFYNGNNAASDGTYQSLQFARGDPRYESSDAERLAEQALGRELDPGEVSAYWTGLAFDHIRAEPLAWVALLGRKLLLLVNATEIIDTEDQYTYAAWSPVLRLSGTLLHFGVIAPLAFIGVLAPWPQRRRLWLLYLMAATYATSVLLFYVVARYRLPLVPFVLIAAGAAVAQSRSLFARIRQLPRIRLATMGAAVAIVTLLCNLPFLDRTGMGAATHYNMGIALHAKGDDAAALAHYQRALEIVPDYPEALWAAGLSFAARKDLVNAISSYRAALALRPELAPVHESLANALSKTGDISGAISHYEKSLELEVNNAAAHYHLAVALAISNRVKEGRAHAEIAVPADAALARRAGCRPRRHGAISRRHRNHPGCDRARQPGGQCAAGQPAATTAERLREAPALRAGQVVTHSWLRTAGSAQLAQHEAKASRENPDRRASGTATIGATCGSSTTAASPTPIQTKRGIGNERPPGAKRAARRRGLAPLRRRQGQRILSRFHHRTDPCAR